MEQTTLNVQLRTERGKGPARRLRAKGLIPAVLYRGTEEPVHLTVDPKNLEKSISDGVHTLLKLDVEGGGEPSGQVAILKELQRDPVYSYYLHADFILVDLDKAMDVDVAFNLTGHPKGVALGGILEPIMRHVRVRCLPVDIPRHILVDVSELDIGDVIHLKEIAMPDKVECLENLEAPVVTVSAPKAEEEPTVEEEEAEVAEGEAAEGEAAEGETPKGEAKAAPEGDKDKKGGKKDKKG